MKKLEDIPKQDFFQAPENYFDKLPNLIADRVARPAESQSAVRIVLQLALPVVVLLVVGVFWFSNTSTENPEAILATVDSQELVTYLADSETLSFDDFMDEVNPNAAEADALEEVVFELQWREQNLDDLMIEIETNNL